MCGAPDAAKVTFCLPAAGRGAATADRDVLGAADARVTGACWWNAGTNVGWPLNTLVGSCGGGPTGWNPPDDFGAAFDFRVGPKSGTMPGIAGPTWVRSTRLELFERDFAAGRVPPVDCVRAGATRTDSVRCRLWRDVVAPARGRAPAGAVGLPPPRRAPAGSDGVGVVRALVADRAPPPGPGPPPAGVGVSVGISVCVGSHDTGAEFHHAGGFASQSGGRPVSCGNGGGVVSPVPPPPPPPERRSLPPPAPAAAPELVPAAACEAALWLRHHHSAPNASSAHAHTGCGPSLRFSGARTPPDVFVVFVFVFVAI